VPVFPTSRAVFRRVRGFSGTPVDMPGESSTTMKKSTEEMNITGRAESWAASLWREALPRWKERPGQDTNYRLHVVFPALRSALSDHFPGGNPRILELGCGDGNLLDERFVRERLENGGEYLGIDISPELLETAAARHPGGNIRFLTRDVTKKAFVEHVTKRETTWDVVVSILAIQEIPDLESFMDNLSRVASSDTLILFVAVHPDFGRWLMETGRMRKEDALSHGTAEGMQWRWAGYYPIVDEGREPFLLPYFHRSMDDYLALFRKFGFGMKDVVEIPDREHLLPELVERKISPFVPFETNLYWPRIAAEPSSVLFIAMKESRYEHR